ncbi:unnamed protein product [Adineta steineri]|uniref:Jacalin-type lectin domain-containing protein n=1 Tax=Adineta steineri TaxID=433720 RepID=A0A819T6Y1_9BILA|nr:unnamed protein product [Adineta steineri]
MHSSTIIASIIVLVTIAAKYSSVATHDSYIQALRRRTHAYNYDKNQQRNMFLRRLAQQLIEDEDSDENLRSAAWKRDNSASALPIIQPGKLYGSSGGAPFDDSTHFTSGKLYAPQTITMTRISTNGQNTMESISITYGTPDETTPVVCRDGVTGGTQSGSAGCGSVTLGSDEKIVTVIGKYGSAVDALQFVTNKDRTIPDPKCGGTGGVDFTEKKQGYYLSYISGTTIDRLFSIQFHWAPFPALPIIQPGKLYGASGGAPFDDSTYFKSWKLYAPQTITMTQIPNSPSPVIGSISITYKASDETTPVVCRDGATGGTACGPVTLDSDEKIVTVKVRTGSAVDALQFVTNKGRTIPDPKCGGTGGASFTDEITGYYLSYISGTTVDHLNSIQFHWAPFPANNDSMMNGDETDVDCGGSSGNKCAVGKACKVNTDCDNVLCTGGICSSPSCSDGLKNGGEADVDCGGPCSTKCDSGKTCSSATDCVSKVCSGNQCQAPMNHDNVMNGDETDVDCGGSSGNKCAVGKICKATSDCNNVLCTGGICSSPSCSDGLKNGGEADVDCGGPCSTKCDSGKTCSSATDCVSKVCSGNQCQAPMNHDNVMNGDETDVDCGGSSGNKCAVGKICKATSDCNNVLCTGGICSIPAPCSTICCGHGTVSCTACLDATNNSAAAYCSASSYDSTNGPHGHLNLYYGNLASPSCLVDAPEYHHYDVYPACP